MDSNTKLPTVVVAGYGSWPTAPQNPCAQVVRELSKQSYDSFNLHAVEMPVVSAILYDRVDEIINQVKPDIWIGLGVAVRYTVIKVEHIGLNIIDLPVPDAAGDLTGKTPIVEAGPLAYASSLPNEAIVDALTAADIPAINAYYAGTHLCNQMLYTSLHLAATKCPAMQAGFLHLPQTKENILASMGRVEPGPYVPFSTLVSAVLTAIKTSVRELDYQCN